MRSGLVQSPMSEKKTGLPCEEAASTRKRSRRSRPCSGPCHACIGIRQRIPCRLRLLELCRIKSGRSEERHSSRRRAGGAVELSLLRWNRLEISKLTLRIEFHIDHPRKHRAADRRALQFLDSSTDRENPPPPCHRDSAGTRSRSSEGRAASTVSQLGRGLSFFSTYS